MRPCLCVCVCGPSPYVVNARSVGQNGPFLMSQVTAGHEIESKAVVCQNGDSVSDCVVCTATHTLFSIWVTLVISPHEHST